MKLHFLTIKTFLFVSIFFQVSVIQANSIFELPTPKRFVNDYADLLTDREEAALEKKVVEIDNSTTNQIAIVTVSSLEGHTPANFARKLANQWGVGQKGKDNGVLILIKPKYAHERGQVYIAVGYGLEHVITNEQAQSIVDHVLIPHFKKEKFGQGLEKAIDSLTMMALGEIPEDPIDRYFVGMVWVVASLLIWPLLYLIYLRHRKVPEKYAHFYVHGAYNAKNLITQVESMEKKYGKTYSKFKRRIQRYELISKKKLLKYADKIDEVLFCYLLDGRKRTAMFWEMADPFLKAVLFYLAGIILWGAAIFYSELNFLAAIMGTLLAILIIGGLFSFLISILQLYQTVLRMKAKSVGGVALGIFTLNTLFKRNIKKKYNPQNRTYMYYPHIIYHSSGPGSSGYGGGYGYGGGGGFGGGGFGGGGAGGSW